MRKVTLENVNMDEILILLIDNVDGFGPDALMQVHVDVLCLYFSILFSSITYILDGQGEGLHTLNYSNPITAPSHFSNLKNERQIQVVVSYKMPRNVKFCIPTYKGCYEYFKKNHKQPKS